MVKLKNNEWFEQLKTTGKPSLEEIAKFCPELELLEKMKVTPHDPIWHAEGNVWIHTSMVLKALYELLENEAKDIEGEQRQILILSAAFHDIAKPLVTKEKQIQGQTRIVSPKHELIGRSYLLPLLTQYPLSLKAQESICGLVGYHILPKFFVVKDFNKNKYHRLAKVVDPELIYWLEKADMMGRICPDQNSQIEYLELFKEFCLEYKCWHRLGNAWAPWQKYIKETLKKEENKIDKVFAYGRRDFEGGVIFTPEEAVAKFGYSKKISELIIAVGPSGAGKSSFYNKHLCDEWESISLDSIREELCGKRSDQSKNNQVLRLAKSRLQIAFRNNKKVFWDATSLRSDFRDPLIEMAKDYNALVTIISFIMPPKFYLERNKKRQHTIPEIAVYSQLEKAQWPEIDEGHRYLELNDFGEIRFSLGFLYNKKPWGLKLNEGCVVL